MPTTRFGRCMKHGSRLLAAMLAVLLFQLCYAPAGPRSYWPTILTASTGAAVAWLIDACGDWLKSLRAAPTT